MSISETSILTSLSHLDYRAFVATRHAIQNQNRVLGQASIIRGQNEGLRWQPDAPLIPYALGIGVPSAVFTMLQLLLQWPSMSGKLDARATKQDL